MNATERAALHQGAVLYDELTAAVDERTLEIVDRRRRTAVIRGRGWLAGVGGDNGNAVAARNDDDDDGGGGGDDDDDDDDPDDDQYEEEREECERAVNEARQDFRATQSAEHRFSHQQNLGRSAHRAVHRQLEDADLAQRRLMQAAREECDDIGGGGGGGDDDDDDDD